MEELLYGCIGRKLTHSYSVPVHAMLADYDYRLAPMEPEELDRFMTEHKFKGINVTIPYKRDVIPYLDYIDPVAEAIGAVNTIVNKDGKLYGYNTDIYGLTKLLEKNEIEIKGKKVLILGTGGTSRTAMATVEKLGAREYFRVSRNAGEGILSYSEAETNHNDAEVIINCTPVGMYPDKIGMMPIDISKFEKLEGVADAVYNPLRPAMILEAQKRGLKASGGLYMLVMQAVEAVRHFTGNEIPDEKCEQAYLGVLSKKRNIVLTGMPGSGKTTIGKLLAEKLGREFVDTDDLIIEKEGREISEIFADKGEAYFRDVESAVIDEIKGSTGLVIATGGGAILREKNVDALKANGKIYFIDRALEYIVPTSTRPLSSDFEALKKRYEERYPIYKSTADYHLEAGNDAQENAEKIKGDFLK